MRARSRDRARPSALAPFWEIDFTGRSAGYSTTAPSGFAYAQAASISSVQTGTSTLVTIPSTADVVRIGRLDDAWELGLVHEPPRINYLAWSYDFSQQGSPGKWIDSPSSVSITRTAGKTDPSGGSLATRVQIAAATHQLGENSALAMPGETAATASVWIRNGTPNVNFYRSLGGRIGSTASAGASWSRVSISGAIAGAETTALVPVDGRDWSAIGGLTAGTRDVEIFGAQREGGTYPTSLIPSNGAQTARAGGNARVLAARWMPHASKRLSLEIRFHALASRAELEGMPYLWHTFDNASAFFTPSTGVLTIRDTSGATNTCTLPAWSRYDLVELWISYGGGAATVVKYRLNGGSVVTLVVLGSALASVVTATSRDLYVMNANNAPSGHVSSIVHRIRGYSDGCVPALAA